MSFSTVCQNINTTVIQTQNNSSTVESQYNQQQKQHQPLLSLNQIIGCCDHRNIIRHQTLRPQNDQGEHLPVSMLVKKNCVNCGVFISKLRTVNIERIFYFGDKLKQQAQTIYLACAYFDLLLFRQFIQDKQKQANTFKICNNNNELSIERSKPINNEEFSVICQTPINEKVRERNMNLKAQMCLLLASKFDELDEYIPLIRDFQKLARYEFAYRDCQDEEEAILKQMNWQLGFITPYHIIESLIMQGVIFEDDKLKSGNNMYDNRYSSFSDESLRMIRKKAEFFCRLSVITNFQMQIYKPSYIALSCIMASRLACQVVPWWNDKLIELTQMNIHTDKTLRECFDKLYMLYDENYVPQGQAFNKAQQKFKSTISTCDANTLDHTQINGIQPRKSKVLEQNQNITNDSFIALSANKQGKDQDTVPRYAEDTAPRYAEDQYNFNLDVGDESHMSKKHIDNLPESHIANRQSQINLNLHLVNNNSSSNRTSTTNLLTGKFKNSENYLSDNSMTVKNFLASKRKSDLVKVNKENHGIPNTVKSMISTIHLEQKQGRQLLNSNSVVIKDENFSKQLMNNQLEQTKTFNSSQVFQVQNTRLSSVFTNYNQNDINIQDLQNQAAQKFLEQTQRTSSLTNLNNQIAQQKPIMQKLSHPSNKLVNDKVLKQKNDNKQSIQIKTVRVDESQIQGKKTKQRKLSTCSNTSLNKVQNATSLTRKCTNNVIVNQKNVSSTNEYMVGRPVKNKIPKSSRNSTSTGLNDTLSKEPKKNDLKIEELRMKYQSENTIYEKQVFGTGVVQQGRNLQHSMLSGFHAHSKTYAVLNPQNILNKKSISRERSISECELYHNPYGNLNINANKQNAIKKAVNIKPLNINDHIQLTTIGNDNDNIKIKNTIVIEDDQEGDKTLNDLSITHAYADEMMPADEDTVVIKRPMSSRKSKSIENVNKFISNRRKSNTSNNNNSNTKAIIDIYKRQYNQHMQSFEKNEHTRNILAQTSTRIATIDLQNYSRPPSTNKTNYIKKNISHVHNINHQLHQSIDINSSIESINNQNEFIITKREPLDINGKRDSRGHNQVYPPKASNLGQKHTKKKLSSQIIKLSLSKRRISESKHNNNSTLNQSNHAVTSTVNSQIRKSTQQNTIRLLLNHKSQANIIEQRKSIDPKNRGISKEVNNSTLPKFDNVLNKKNNQGINSNNLSACSSQVQLKERPFSRFLNPENKQLFNAFTKNFQNQKKTPTPQQSQKINFEQLKIKVISPENNNVQNKGNSLLKALRSQQKFPQNIVKLNTSRQASNHSTSCDIVHPPLSNRSGNISARQITQQINSTASNLNLVKFQKFQARQPTKQQNHSLIERALMKKSQLTSILKPYQTKQAAQTLDNTYESEIEQKPQVNNMTYQNIQQSKNLSVNNSTLMLPVLSQHQNILGLHSAKNVRVSHSKTPSQVQPVSHNPQDIPPQYSNRPSKQSVVSSSNLSMNQSIQGSTIMVANATHNLNKPPLLATCNTTQNLMNPQKLMKHPEQRLIQLHTKNSNSQNSTINKLPQISAPVSARVSNRYAKELSQSSNCGDKLVIKEEDEFKKMTQQFKKQIQKITNNSTCN